MHIRMIAVGDRQPAWVNEAVEGYARRLPVQWQFRLEPVPTAARSGGGNAKKATEVEGAKVLRMIRPAERLVALDERGKSLSSRELAARLGEWQADGRGLCFLIGGPDGLADACMKRAGFRWSLSRHTLPHGLARVLAVEQLYRAWTLIQGHPYHRE